MNRSQEPAPAAPVRFEPHPRTSASRSSGSSGHRFASEDGQHGLRSFVEQGPRKATFHGR